MVQWLGLGALTAMAQVQSLVGELRSRKPYHATKKTPRNWEMRGTGFRQGSIQ